MFIITCILNYRMECECPCTGRRPWRRAQATRIVSSSNSDCERIRLLPLCGAGSTPLLVELSTLYSQQQFPPSVRDGAQRSPTAKIMSSEETKDEVRGEGRGATACVESGAFYSTCIAGLARAGGHGACAHASRAWPARPRRAWARPCAGWRWKEYRLFKQGLRRGW
jgi:hypothetical protein